MKRFLVAAALSCFAFAPALMAQSSPANTAPAAPAAGSDARGDAYYNFIMGHLNEELYEDTGSGDYATQAIEFYKKALELDPDSAVISERLAETYAKSQRIREAVLAAQDILQRDPNNLAAHRLLARVYVRTLGEMSAAASQKDTLARAVEQYEQIVRLDPSDTDAVLWLARLYRFQNNHDKAEQVLRKLLDHEPANEAALEQYTQLLLDQGRAAEAIARLQKLADQTSDARLFSLLGDAYAQTHDEARAEEAYRKAMALEPDEAGHLRGLAQTLLSEKKFDEALAQYQRLSELEPDEAENYLRIAEIYLQEKKFDLAEASVLRAKERAPGSLEVIYNESMIYQAQSRYDDAIRVLADAVARLKKDPDRTNPRALSILYEQLGRLYRRAENYPEALRTFQEMMKLGPSEDKQGRLQLIETYRASGNIDSAIAEAQKAMQLSPEDRGMKVTYALLLGEKQKIDEAAQTLRSLLNGSPADREIYLQLAQVYERGRRYPEAEQAAHTAEKMTAQPPDSDTVWFLLGAIYERQKKYDLAEQQFRKALEVNPRDPAVLNYYGYMLADRGIRLDEATDLVKRALAVEGDNGAYLDSLGWAYFKQNRLAEAEEYLRKAIAQDKHDPTILGHLGDVYYKTGRTALAASTWEKAMAEWQRALPADYEADKVSELEKKLANLKRHLAEKSPGAAQPQ